MKLTVTGFLERAESFAGSLDGARVLDIGCDLAGRHVREAAERFGARDAIGLTLSGKPHLLTDRARIERGDIRGTGYEAGSFDLLFSRSAFEHVHGFDLAVREMHRILRPGGCVYARFGPIWSTSYGHHLWIDVAGTSYTYHTLPLPPWCHLLMDPPELHAWLRERVDETAAAEIVRFVSASDAMNRLHYEDYAAIFEASPFEVVLMKGYDHHELAERYRPLVTPEILARLRSRYPRCRNLHHDGIEVVLRKP